MPQAFRIGIVLQGSKNWIGGIEYSKNLLKALYTLPEDEQAGYEFVPISGTPREPGFYADMPKRFLRELREVSAAGNRRISRWLSNRLFGRSHNIVQAARTAGIQFLYPHIPHPLRSHDLTGAAWIPDFQYKHYPQFFRRRQLLRRDRELDRLAGRSSCVVLSSRTVERDFQRFFPGQEHKSRVLSFRSVLNGRYLQQDVNAVQRKFSLPARFFIVCNQFWRHKNHLAIFEALRILRGQACKPVLVCTGKLGDYRDAGFGKQVAQTIQTMGLTDQIHLLGLIPRADQVQLLRRSLGIIQPSLFEGWSTVVEDARALGKRLALSDIAVHREQDPPDAVFFDPHSPEQLSSLLGKWWDELEPGPLPDREAAATEQNRVATVQFAREFLKIAHSAKAA